MENSRLLEFPFSTTVRNSIREMNLISDFTFKAEKVFIFSSGIIEELEQLKNRLRAGDADIIVKYFDERGDWDQPANAYDTFLPNAIPKAIVNALAGREF